MIRPRPAAPAPALIMVLVILALPAAAEPYDMPSSHVVRGVPLVRQAPGLCGPASLAMVLRYWGVNASQEEIAGRVYDPAENTTHVSDMVAYPRSLGFEARALRGSIGALRYFLAADMPVIVLQRYSARDPRGHYRVVVGYDDASQTLLVLDPARGAVNTSYAEFAYLWSVGGEAPLLNWTLIIYPASPRSRAETPITIIKTTTLTLHEGEACRASEPQWIPCLAPAAIAVAAIAAWALRRTRAQRAPG